MAPLISYDDRALADFPRQEFEAIFVPLAVDTGKNIRVHSRLCRAADDSGCIDVFPWVDAGLDRDVTIQQQYISFLGDRLRLTENQRLRREPPSSHEHYIISCSGGLVPLAWADRTPKGVNLYFCFNLLAGYNRASRELLNHIARRTREVVPVDHAAMSEAKMASAITKFFDSAMLAPTTQMEEQARYLEADIHSREQSLTSLVRQLEDLRITIVAKKSVGKESGAELKSNQLGMFEQLRSAGLFETFTARSGSITGVTSPITIEDNGTDYAMGRYAILINFNGRITISSIDGGGGGGRHCHPHVSPSGAPCLGNLSSSVPKLIGKFNIAETFQVLRSFLSSYCPEGAYTRIVHWGAEERQRAS